MHVTAPCVRQQRSMAELPRRILIHALMAIPCQSWIGGLRLDGTNQAVNNSACFQL
ncbi:hypothetical protein K469DRAFT_249903 [Zopfia rhizophila CBS 207.26]|uniref:Uncharacterized protein n=1 Tax=Zopfia rhizophila CBS 207.26 TaxID=1314779 RepID=A0A6A6DQY7_9PEZI|nr:hypothetical protein K469DRAFT_249903 [Zopfia rhizophila CBS 207.26]